jgi:hypothetical protein
MPSTVDVNMFRNMRFKLIVVAEVLGEGVKRPEEKGAKKGARPEPMGNEVDKNLPYKGGNWLSVKARSEMVREDVV